LGRPAVVVGSGPNGLSAAISLARAGIDVEVLEGAEATGGRTEELTLPGHSHDTCSALHPLLAAPPDSMDEVVSWVALQTAVAP
jgi:phytoene dehydrogenase-like protein